MKDNIWRSDTPSTHTFIDLFAGCGGLSLGLMQAGWQGLLAVERDRHAFETMKANLIDGDRYSYNWPDWLPKSEHEIGAFISDYKHQLKKLRGTVDLIAGGPPCQGFSMAGRRKKNDPRNQLFEHYLEVVKLVHPRFLILENVPGISVTFVKHGDGTDVPKEPVSTKQGDNDNLPVSEIIMNRLRDTKPGYQVFGQVVRASEHGVPQWRPRFIMFGIRKDVWRTIVETAKPHLTPHELLATFKKDFLKNKGLTVPVKCADALEDFVGLERQDSQESKGFKELVYKTPKQPSAYLRLLRSDIGETAPNSLRLANHRPDTVQRWERLLAHPEIRRGVKLNTGERKLFGIEGKHSFAILDPHQPSHTLTTLPDDLLHYCEPRILTVRECARLQSFPDWFEFRGKYTTGGKVRKKEAPRYSQIGNAVPPLLAEALGRVLMHLSTGTRL